MCHKHGKETTSDAEINERDEMVKVCRKCNRILFRRLHQLL